MIETKFLCFSQNWMPFTGTVNSATLNHIQAKFSKPIRETMKCYAIYWR